ncbi:hypothetical protein [Noviherbaspirillum sedimenti]|uniref:Enoyl-CoA hydratase n=1 Tax=Noviherbaspirillum sedimenti TaxID=2320865 RepID=A0A3A3G440_9BURK|nr:hypothetical protein [Noviherbaspirillum sedimenti]RJG03248.1 hypothetical protein D3878_17995 [Noviherbaspirillum sedimenti]
MKTQVSIGKNGLVALIQISNLPVNTSVSVVKKWIVSQAQGVSLDPNIQIVVIAYAGRTFMTGGAIKESDLDNLFEAMPELSSN